jgi:hypothetical protein
VKLGARSSLADVAVAVGDALRRAEIRAVLTGGACASLYAGGAYASIDADFVIAGKCGQSTLDEALAPLGFTRHRDRYVHKRLRYFVEFRSGPLGIGEDFRIRPVWRRRKSARTLALSATDACRDRLAAFYHWSDRQSLATAVAIARRNRVSMAKIRRWSQNEGNLSGYRTFVAELAAARKSRR